MNGNNNGVFEGHNLTADSTTEKIKFKESLLLVEMSGEIFYLAKVPQNQYPTPFKLTASKKNYAVFENPTHDFPKKLEYELIEDATLTVKVSDGDKRGFMLQFQKAFPQ